MDLLALLPEKSQMPGHSQDTLIQKIAENTTFVLKVSLVNTDAQLEQFSRSEIQMVQETAKTLKMFPDGKLKFSCKHKPFSKTLVLKPHIKFTLKI